ncbi:transferase [Bifidobacterium sp. DSM 109960]|uniref:Transferase n=1 Tax=Bifidobacterium erythrocebi TaxID=2675325 RepID=A0A7Y0EUS8_9BIFI|nr:YesL family protein [Bifidobacterium sp. DSM 109960]NMM96824.1 transferase [Bifidobacterium sp. DSM 109960]
MDSRFFREDNPYNVFMNTVGDLAMLSVAWVVCSLPIVTIGASTAAACEVARTMQEDRDNGIFRGFWKAFKRRFGITMALTAIIACVWGLGAFDLWFLSRQSGNAVSVVYGITVAVFAIIGVALAFVLPLTGRSKLSVFEQIKQSARLAVLKPMVAIAVFVLDVLPIALLATVPGAIAWVPLLWAILGVGVSAWLQMRMIRKAFALE